MAGACPPQGLEWPGATRARHPARTLRGARRARHRGDVGGLPGPGQPAAARGGDQGRGRGVGRRQRLPEPAGAGGAARGFAEPSQHRRGARHRAPRGCALPGHRAAAGRDAAGASVPWRGAARAGSGVGGADRPRAGRSPCPRHHSPGPQAGERLRHPDGSGEAPRLRHRQGQSKGHRGPRAARPHGEPGRLGDAHRSGAGHPGLHVARAGEGRAGRCPQRHLLAGHHPAGGALRAARLPRRVGGGERVLDPPRRASAAASLGPGGRGPGRPALPGQGLRAAVPVGTRRRLQPRGAARHRGDDARPATRAARSEAGARPPGRGLDGPGSAPGAGRLRRGARGARLDCAAADPPAHLPSRLDLGGSFRARREDGAFQRGLDRRLARAVHHQRRLAGRPEPRRRRGTAPLRLQRGRSRGAAPSRLPVRVRAEGHPGRRPAARGDAPGDRHRRVLRRLGAGREDPGGGPLGERWHHARVPAGERRLPVRRLRDRPAGLSRRRPGGVHRSPPHRRQCGDGHGRGQGRARRGLEPALRRRLRCRLEPQRQRGPGGWRAPRGARVPLGRPPRGRPTSALPRHGQPPDRRREPRGADAGQRARLGAGARRRPAGGTAPVGGVARLGERGRALRRWAKGALVRVRGGRLPQSAGRAPEPGPASPGAAGARSRPGALGGREPGAGGRRGGQRRFCCASCRPGRASHGPSAHRG